MGMPISLAMRGRHAADEVGRAAWAEVMDSLREVDAVFSTYRARLGRLPAGPRRAHARRLPARGDRGARAGGAGARGAPAARSASTARARTAGSSSTRAAW